MLLHSNVTINVTKWCSFFSSKYRTYVECWFFISKVRIHWNRLFVNRLWEGKLAIGNCPFLDTFVELFWNSNLFSPKLVYSLDYKSLPENLVIVLSSSFSVSVFCLMVLSLWANEMFCRKSENANQLMLFINFFSEMSSNKILQQQKKENSFQLLYYLLHN